jgi:hypothetical protein
MGFLAAERREAVLPRAEIEEWPLCAPFMSG